MAKAVIINDLLSILEMKVSRFEKEIDVANGTISKAIERESDLSGWIIEKIVEKYPEVQQQWLITGKGAILTEGTYLKGGKKQYHYEGNVDIEVKESKQKEVIALGKQTPLRLKPDEYAEAFGNWKGLPMFNTPVTASFIETYQDEKTYTPQYYLHDPRFRDCDFGAIITGDSMYSEIRHGDFIACKEIQDRRFIVYGDIYYVVATNGLETCKYVNPDPKNEDNLLLVPRNESISPSPIPKDMILKMYKVRGIIRGY